MSIPLLLIVLVAYFFIGNLTGYVVHKVLHCRWSGKAYKDHLHHHTSIYPPSDYLSEEYREPPLGSGQAKYYLVGLAVVASPLLFLGIGYALAAFAMAVGVLKLNAWMHDSLHIKGHRLERYGWFLSLRRLHFQHHIDVKTNLGIISFFPDIIFQTFNRAKDVRCPE